MKKLKRTIGLILAAMLCMLPGNMQSESEDEMPNIPKIKIGNTEYTVKDAVARSALFNDGVMNIFPFLNGATSEWTHNGITRHPNPDGTITYNGKATALYNDVFFYVDVDNEYIKKGDKLGFRYSGDYDPNMALEIWYVPTGGSLTRITSVKAKAEIGVNVPSNCEKIYVRISIPNGSVIDNKNVGVHIYSENFTPYKSIKEWIPIGTDFDTIRETGNYGALDSEGQYVNCPIIDSAGTLLVLASANSLVEQIFFDWNGYRMFVRRYYNGAWNDWRSIRIGEYDVMGEHGILADQTDLNDIQYMGAYLMTSGNSYEHEPPVSDHTGLLVVFRSSGVFYQMFLPWTPNAIYLRRKHTGQASFSDWCKTGGELNVTNEYTFNEYSNSFTATVTPTITTDDNNWLQPTGTSDDVSASILALLQTGCCQLAPGEFYVDPNKLEMPAGSILRGCGEASKIILRGSADGYAVKMGSKCQVSDLCIKGQGTRQATVGNRHGILWQGDYTESHDDYTQPRLGIIDNVRIGDFTGGGITCYDTGYATFNNLHVTNAYIENCSAGINVSYWSEYHQFTNVHTQTCTFGCVNNGGNNVFVNCNFSSCSDTGFLMDNSSDQNPNNAHGSCIGCVFNHENSNNGIAVKVLGTHNGFVFSGCQIFYGTIVLEDNYGIEFIGCNFGPTSITITDGGLTLFSNNLHVAAPTITVNGNSHVIFRDCYVRNTGESVGL